MNILEWNALSEEEKASSLARPSFSESDEIKQRVAAIIENVKTQGDAGLKSFTKTLDKVELESIQLSKEVIKSAAQFISDDLKAAMKLAAKNITVFHEAQKRDEVTVETVAGVKCQQVYRPIKSVGLYIPGGSAPLLSTVLMLAIPAKLAGCQSIYLASPPPIANEILFAADLCGIDTVYQMGGAQAIAAMAFGTESIPKVDKIFGPGNAYVTEAKRQVSQVSGGAAIDMPAGPSEVLVIADCQSNPQFVAADLLSQAEHGPDSQVILVTPSDTLAKAVLEAIETQLAELPRAEIAQQALSSSKIIVTDTLEQAVEVSNRYGPEHLIIQTEDAEQYADSITNAGSVFLGAWSPESVGDYASGTNHVLPTYGYTSTYSSLGLADFQKRMTIQQLSPEGLKAIGNAVELMASAEKLQGHKNAVTVRLNALKAGEK